MELSDVMKELAAAGNDGTRRIFKNHGAREPIFGVKIADMKKILKRTGKDHHLALELYDTGNSDAMYLAGLMADEKQITKTQLRKWVRGAYWYMLSESTVAGLAAESPHGIELAQEWIDSKKEMVAAAGWATYAGVISLRQDQELDQKEITGHVDRIRKTIHQAPNRVRYTMNNFIICVGSYVEGFQERAIDAGEAIGKVSVDMGKTECKVPYAPDYIRKIADRGRIGKKRKHARC